MNPIPYQSQAEIERVQTQKVVQIARRLADGHRPGVLGTVDEKGLPHVRWMQTLSLQEFPLFYAITAATSRKVEHIHHNPAVNWMFSNEENTVVVNMIGRAKILTDSFTVNRVWKLIENKSNAFFLSLQSEESSIAVIETVIEDMQCVIPRYELKYFTTTGLDKEILQDEGN